MSIKTVTAIVASLIIAGVVHGRLSDRWGPPKMLTEAGAGLDRLPDQIAGWTATKIPVDPRVLLVAGASNIVKREYKSPAGDDTVQIMLVVGRAGPVSLHPPTVCFVSGGVRQMTGVTRTKFGDAEFATCKFANDPKDTQFMTYWSMSGDGKTWSSPENPRFAFAHYPRLYKLYVITAVDSNEEIVRRRRDFTDQIMSELSTLLF